MHVYFEHAKVHKMQLWGRYAHRASHRACTARGLSIIVSKIFVIFQVVKDAVA